MDSISWGPAARSTDSASTSLDSAGTQQANGRTWLPITIKGVHLVLAASGKPSKKAGKPHKAHAKHAARSAAAWPAVSSALAVAKRLLPGIPVQLQDVKVELKVGFHGRCGCHGCASLQQRVDRQPPSSAGHTQNTHAETACHTCRLHLVLLLPFKVHFLLPSWTHRTAHCCGNVLQALGMQLLLKRAALHWSVNEQQGSLSSVLLLQDFTLSPGTPTRAVLLLLPLCYDCSRTEQHLANAVFLTVDSCV